jgi:hypothetical protein
MQISNCRTITVVANFCGLALDMCTVRLQYTLCLLAIYWYSSGRIQLQQLLTVMYFRFFK